MVILDSHLYVLGGEAGAERVVERLDGNT